MEGEREDKGEECEREGPWFLHNHILIKKGILQEEWDQRGRCVFNLITSMQAWWVHLYMSIAREQHPHS